MSTFKKIKSILVVVFFLINNLIFSQTYHLNKSQSLITVFGTSNIHDWEVVSKNYEGKLLFKNLETMDISKIEVIIPSESLKSGKKGMDKNTYKALKTSKYPSIIFKSTEIKKITNSSKNTYIVDVNGDLKITDKTQNIPLKLEITKTNNTVVINGSISFKMTQYNVEPPTALFGTIKTGDEITIKFQSTFNNENK